MNPQQKAEFIKYGTSFVAMLQRKGFSREQASQAMISANACLLSKIWHIKPIGEEADKIKAFATRIQDEVITLFYDSEVQEVEL